jgi:hypothetical protein
MKSMTAKQFFDMLCIKLRLLKNLQWKSGGKTASYSTAPKLLTVTRKSQSIGYNWSQNL